MPSGGGSTDEYRSVIDDLTVENKRLREELRRYKMKTNLQLEKNKLFEVRIHSLPPGKRRELESALRSIASSLDYTNGDHSDSTPNTSKQCLTLEETSNSTKKSISTSTSNSNLQASSNDSMTTSTQPTTNNHEDLAYEKSKSTHFLSGPSKNYQNAPNENNYGLLEYDFTKMTDMDKRMLVVQRLEQLFTGEKGIMMGVHRQAAHEQEVSCSIPGTDSDSQQVYGAREAHMKPPREENTSQPSATPNAYDYKSLLDTSDDTTSNASYSGQRPTRLIDLDPDRAQVPSDNVEYIRHLGLSTPQLAGDESSDTNRGRGGWVYLNLLINMAQLHIINVTADFIRSAVLDVSEKFELSKDGQMLRWKSGSKRTHPKSHNSSSSGMDIDYLNSQGTQTNNDQYSSRPLLHDAQEKFSTLPQRSNSDFQYKPLFYHRSPSDDLSEGNDSIIGSSHTTESNGTQTSRIPVRRNQKYFLSTDQKMYEDGSIIFYSGVNFCTDFSGDRQAGLVQPSTSNPCSEEGSDIEQGSCLKSSKLSSLGRTNSGSLLPYRPFKEPSSRFESCMSEMSEENNLAAEEITGEDDLAGQSPNDFSKPLTSMQPLETSGIGGIHPADHFELQVLTHRISVKSSEPARRSHDISHITERLLKRGSGPEFGSGIDHEMSCSDLKTSSTQESECSNKLSQCNYSPSHQSIQTKIVSTEISMLPPSKFPSSTPAYSPQAGARINPQKYDDYHGEPNRYIDV